MKRTSLTFVIAVFGIVGGVNDAIAHDNVHFSINLGAPAYYSQAPVYVVDPPVYYASQPVVYYRPAPVYFSPRAFYGDGDESYYRAHRHHGFHRGWYKQHEHDD